MAKKEIIGISVEHDKLKLAKVALVRNMLRVTHVQTIKLTEALTGKPGSTSGQDTGVDAFDIDQDSESVFGLEGEVESLDLDSASGDDNWDMADADSNGGFQQENSNAATLAGVLTSLNHKGAQVALTIPSGLTHFQTMDKVDPKKVGKKKFMADVKDSLNLFYGKEIADDQIRFQLRKNNSLLITSIDGAIPTLKLIDETVPLYKSKIHVKEVIPDELVLSGLVRANYSILDHQITCIVHVDEHSSRIIFLEGREFHSILPDINEGTKNRNVAQTIFSKILFEIDRGKIPTVDRVIIAGNTYKTNIVSFLQEQFLDVEVTGFEFSGNKLEVLETVANEYQNYTRAIGVAWAAFDAQKSDFLPITFIPKYVAVRQQVFKLNWHGYILLAMIALTPAVLNQLIKDKSAQIQQIESRIDILNSQITQVSTIAAEVNRLSSEFNIFNRQVRLLDTLSYNSLKWSRTLAILNNDAELLRGYWVVGLASDGNGLIVQGTTTNRDRIPQISNRFERATIQNVNEREYRGETVYDFMIRVTQIVDDYRIFKPDPVQPPDNLLILQEISANGIIENQ